MTMQKFSFIKIQNVTLHSFVHPRAKKVSLGEQSACAERKKILKPAAKKKTFDET
jgi:hypothetical protein